MTRATAKNAKAEALDDTVVPKDATGYETPSNNPTLDQLPTVTPTSGTSISDDTHVDASVARTPRLTPKRTATRRVKVTRDIPTATSSTLATANTDLGVTTTTTTPSVRTVAVLPVALAATTTGTAVDAILSATIPHKRPAAAPIVQERPRTKKPAPEATVTTTPTLAIPASASSVIYCTTVRGHVGIFWIETKKLSRPAYIAPLTKMFRQDEKYMKNQCHFDSVVSQRHPDDPNTWREWAPGTAKGTFKPRMSLMLTFFDPPKRCCSSNRARIARNLMKIINCPSFQRNYEFSEQLAAFGGDITPANEINFSYLSDYVIIRDVFMLIRENICYDAQTPLTDGQIMDMPDIVNQFFRPELIPKVQAYVHQTEERMNPRLDGQGNPLLNIEIPVILEDLLDGDDDPSESGIAQQQPNTPQGEGAPQQAMTG